MALADRPSKTLITRITTWYSRDTVEPIQVSHAVLSQAWEPIIETTLQCGPFHPLDEALAELSASTDYWIEHYGVQMELEF